MFCVERKELRYLGSYDNSREGNIKLAASLKISPLQLHKNELLYRKSGKLFTFTFKTIFQQFLVR
jgi:hypothetical protein